MIRSSKISIKFANQGKIGQISNFIEEYKVVTQRFVDVLWESRDSKVPSLIPYEITSKIESWLSKRSIQCCAKQASGIVRGTIQKQKRRDFIIKKLNAEGKFKQARKLQAKFDKQKISKPVLKNMKPELDSRFITIDTNPKNSFELWVVISQLGNKTKITIPLNKTKHFNKLNDLGKVKLGIRLSDNSITFMFDIADVEKKVDGKTIGIDIGAKNVLSCSNGFQTKEDCHGHTLDKIQKTLSRRKKGSRGFRRAQAHRTNFINWSVNQLDLSEIKQINIEDIKYMRRGKRCSRYLSHYTYSEIFGALEFDCDEQGVLVSRRNPTYTSQRCSKCGWVCKRNRKGKKFKCACCGFTADADMNASWNLSLELSDLGKKAHLSKANRKGFYWPLVGQKPIVSGALRA